MIVRAAGVLGVLYCVLLAVWWATIRPGPDAVGAAMLVLIALWVVAFVWIRSTDLRVGEHEAKLTPSAKPGAQDTEPQSEQQVLQRLRSRFIAAIGHDLGNPLNSITGFSDMLLTGSSGGLNAEQEQSVRTIRASAEQLSRLMASIVNEAKLSSGTLRLQEQWVSPGELSKEVVRLLKVRAYDRQVEVSASESLPRVFIDRTQTMHALVSLAMLLLESVSSGLTIRLALPRWEKSKSLQVDLGANVDQAAFGSLPIVERLEQDAASSDPLGLEVYVARRIIEAQGGRLWTETGTARGLRVCLTLPAG